MNILISNRWVAALLLVFCLVLPIRAEQLSLTPVLDTATWSGFGYTPQLPVSKWDHPVMRFSLDGVSGVPEQATLRVYYTGTAGAMLHTWLYSNNDWDESPAGKPARENLEGGLEATGLTPAAGYVEFDVSALIAALPPLASTINFEIASGLNTWNYLASRESEYPPQLVLSTGDNGGEVIVSSITVAPVGDDLTVGDIYTFSATVYDQYGQPLAVQTQWSTTGGGTITQEGVFTATTTGGPFDVSASYGDVSGMTSVYVIAPPPANQDPVAQFDASTLSGTAPLQVDFSSTAYDPDGSIVEYSWRVDSEPLGSAEQFSHTFTTAGDYSVELEVTDNQGAKASDSVIIHVAAPPGSTVTTELAPVADTATYAGFGYTPQLPVSKWDHPVMRFSLDGLSGVPEQATLRVYYTGTPGTMLQTWQYANNDWDESPAGKPSRENLSGGLEATGPTSAAGYVEFDVSALIAALPPLASTINFEIASGLNTWNYLASRESGYPPQLVLTTGGGEPDPDGPVSVYAPISTYAVAYGAAALEQPALQQGDHVFFVSPSGNDANPGTEALPWQTPGFAANNLNPGQIAYLREGEYPISEQVVPQNSSITISAYPGETPVIDASAVSMDGSSDVVPSSNRDLGVILIHGVDNVVIRGLTVKESHGAGISVCTSNGSRIVGNTTMGTFSSGINANSATISGCATSDLKILNNTIIDANTLRLATTGYDHTEAPHEAISIMGANGFEIAGNYIHDTSKEGIDVKENSQNGLVRNNLVEDIPRQCYYADAWFGVLRNVEFYGNVGRRCGSGFSVSAEGGDSMAEAVSFHHNLLYANEGTGIYISKFGADGPRHDIQIYNNTVVDNGYGLTGEWMTGGIALLTTNITDLNVYNNIFVDNNHFQMGINVEYDDSLLTTNTLAFTNNVIWGDQLPRSMYLADMMPHDGTGTIMHNPAFISSATRDYLLPDDSPVADKGAYY